MATDAQVDDSTMAFLRRTKGRWQKVAMVYGTVMEALGAEFPRGEVGHELFDRRMRALVSSGQLIAKSDIAHWRFSEVKRP
jgi:hypothetical protein